VQDLVVLEHRCGRPSVKQWKLRPEYRIVLLYAIITGTCIDTSNGTDTYRVQMAYHRGKAKQTSICSWKNVHNYVMAKKKKVD
jgi:hypothetical protein